jgi:hypothetical protein
MTQDNVSKTAGILAVDIMRNDFHRPFVDGKCNRDNIEENVTIGILSGALEYYVDQEILDLAMSVIDDLIEQYGGTSDDNVAA